MPSENTQRDMMYQWSRRPCTTSVQVYTEPPGWVGIVHSATHRSWFRAYADENFPVRWEGGLYPTPANDCDTGDSPSLCSSDINSVTQITSCICTVNVNTSAVFTSTSSEPLPTSAEIIDRLQIGASPPARYDAGTYTLCTTSACSAASPAVKAYLHSSSGVTFDERTIFEVFVNDTATFLFNKLEMISLGQYGFRNPPHFMSFVELREHDARLETDALIDHFFYHQNTAPFIAYRLIQRLVTSNPSPRYMRAVTDAFRTGRYGGTTFSGRHGDLGATFNAILLDPEARSSTLDMDPSHGGLREPLIKLISFMRAMEFVSKDDKEVELYNVVDATGQMVFQSPTVFNFYKPEYQPTGPVIDSDLYAPEAELATAPWIIGFLNGLFSLINFGLNTCDGGFGSATQQRKSLTGVPGFPAQNMNRRCTYPHESRKSPPFVGAVDGSSSDGKLEYAPVNRYNATAVVNELALLLTGGRLSSAARATIAAEYEVVLNGTDTNYIAANVQVCAEWAAEDIASSEECQVAYDALAPIPGTQFDIGSGGLTVQDDNRNNNRFRPAGCYVEGSSTKRLKFNERRSNTGTCTGSYECLCKVRGTAPALKRAQQLIVVTPEFHAVNDPAPLNTPRPPTAEPPSLGRPYKALVVLFFAGGMDSWNLLVPHSGCLPGNFTTNYEQYSRLRSIVAIPQNELLPIAPPPTTQPYNVCTTFGVHPGLPLMQSLYNQGEAAFLTNLGTLVQPITKAEYSDRTIPKPPSLFAHNIQVRATQSLHAQDAVARGVLGRVVEALVQAPVAAVEQSTSQIAPSPPPPAPPPVPAYRTGMYSLAGIKKMLDGSMPANILSTTGAVRLNDFSTLKSPIGNLTGGKLGSAFGETFATMTESSIASMETLGTVLGGITLQSTRWTDTNGDGRVTGADSSCSTICQQFQQVAKVISARAVLQEERQVFYLELGGFDTHNSALEQVQSKMDQTNVALTGFVDEMRQLGVWNNVTVITASDFARTYDSNGAGTDHAWGGQYMMLGGSVRGGTIHGEFPISFLSTSPVHIGRGRLMPTLSWEAVWNGLADWFGVAPDRLTTIVPNRVNFPQDQLFTKDDLFK